MQALLNLAADRTQLYLSPDGQAHATLPSGAATPLYSEDFFTFLHQLSAHQQSPLPNNFQFAKLLRDLDAQAHASNRIQPVPLRTSRTAHDTLLIDLQENFEAIELTRKGWSLTHNFDAPFLRPFLNIPLPAPEPPKHDLTTYLTHLFEIEKEPAEQLALWLAQALMPDSQPPILVITGEARDEAAAKLRTILDPVPQPLFPVPTTINQLGQLALTNRILPFAAYGPLTEKRKSAFNALRKGMIVQLKETNKRRGKIFTKISRPIIITIEAPQQISPTQITIEINKANQGDHPRILGALLNLAAAGMHKSPQPTIQVEHQAIAPQSPTQAPQPDVPGP